MKGQRWTVWEHRLPEPRETLLGGVSFVNAESALRLLLWLDQGETKSDWLMGRVCRLHRSERHPVWREGHTWTPGINILYGTDISLKAERQ